MDPGFLIDGVLRSVMGGGRRKKSKHALRYLTRGHRSLWSNPTTLLTAAGVAWGIYETMSAKGGVANGPVGTPGGGAAAAGPWATPGDQWGDIGGVGPSGNTNVAPGPGVASPLPPLPNIAPAGSPAGSAVAPEVDAAALRLVRLAVSAANADGVMSDRERAAIVQQAQAVGVGAIVEQELQERRPLSQIVTGVTDPAERATLYVFAFTILRADEQVTGAERIFLAQLANLLGLNPAMVEQLEKDTGERIDALGDQGQLGG